MTVRSLVIESQKADYFGFGWPGGRQKNPKMYAFASVANIQPSTMQTKIRAMIRYGFIKDSHICPLNWTRMGALWNDLYTIGNYGAAEKIYELTLIISLALFAFNNSREQYTINPSQGEMPLKFLLNLVDNQRYISLRDFEKLVDGQKEGVARNSSYWKADLLHSNLFCEEQEKLFYTGKYQSFIQEIKTFEPSPLLTNEDWQNIRDNPLIEISPFKNAMHNIFEQMAQDQVFVDQLTDGILTAPLIDVIAEQDEVQIPEVDILSTVSKFSKSIKRVRNATWSIRIKKKYNFSCAVPNCDVTGLMFVDAAHIKPDNAPDGDIPHRTHILNGLCLCKHCHIAFDRGYFSLTDDYRILASSRFNSIPDQYLKTVILSSTNAPIKTRNDNRLPIVEFVQYHRTNYFKV